MEYSTPYLIILGLLATLLWGLNFFYLGKTPEVFYPRQVSVSDRRYQPLRLIVFGIGLIGLLFISYALMGPRKPLKHEKSKIEINDIYFVIDISKSMLANDFDPNRMEVAKEKVLEFIRMRPKDRVCIVIFGEKAFTLLPSTTDMNLIEKVVPEIQTDLLGPGTNIGDAVALATARASDSPVKNKIIILLTDGVSNVGNMTPMQAAEAAHDQKLKIYTIAVASGHEAQIPIAQGVFGTRFMNIPGGGVDYEVLEKMASLTGGKAFEARDTQALKNVFDEIQNLEKTEIEGSTKVVYEELYLSYLLWGVFFFLVQEILRKLYLREVL